MANEIVDKQHRNSMLWRWKHDDIDWRFLFSNLSLSFPHGEMTSIHFWYMYICIYIYAFLSSYHTEAEWPLKSCYERTTSADRIASNAVLTRFQFGTLCWNVHIATWSKLQTNCPIPFGQSAKKNKQLGSIKIGDLGKRQYWKIIVSLLGVFFVLDVFGTRGP